MQDFQFSLIIVVILKSLEILDRLGDILIMIDSKSIFHNRSDYSFSQTISPRMFDFGFTMINTGN